MKQSTHLLLLVALLAVTSTGCVSKDASESATHWSRKVLSASGVAERGREKPRTCLACVTRRADSDARAHEDRRLATDE